MAPRAQASMKLRIPWTARLLKWVQLSKVVRMHKHYRAIKTQLAPSTPAEKAEVRFFCQRLEHYHKKSMRLARIRYFFYAILYAGLLVNVLKIIPFLSFVVEFVRLGGAIFGTTLAFVAVYLIGKQIDLNAELMNECLTHLISYYQKNGSRNTERTLRRIARTI